MKNLYWTKQADNYTLKNNDTELVQLNSATTGNPTFVMGDKMYQISRKGFWNPDYIVALNNEKVLTLSHSIWGSKGTIVLSDGSVYTMDYKTKGGLKLCFYEYDKKILSYGTELKNNHSNMVFNVGVNMMDANNLLILAALGLEIYSKLNKEMTSSDDLLSSLMTATAIVIIF